METTSFSEDLRRYLSMVWHWAWLLLICMLLAGGIAYVLSIRTMPVYQAVTKILINQAPATKATDYASVLTSERLAETYAQMLTTRQVLQGVIDKMSLNTTTEQLRGAILVQPVRDTQLIEIRLEDTNPQMAARLLNELVNVFIEQNRLMQEERFAASKENLARMLDDIDRRIRATTDEMESLGVGAEDQSVRARLETTLAEYRQIYSNLLLSFEQVRLAEVQSTSTLIPVEPAKAPLTPIRPRIFTNTLLASIIGLIIGVVAVFVIETMDDSLKSTDDVLHHLGLPVLGYVARFDRSIRLIAAAQPRSPVAEAFRSLRTNLQFASVDHPLRTILITSPSPSDGKSTVAANLSIVMAQGGAKITLIDGDLRRPNVHKVMGLPNRQGISTLFVQQHADLDDSVQQTAVNGLSVITAGDIPPNPSELLGSDRFGAILEQVGSEADVLVIDSPPVMAVTDSVVLAPRVDGVLVVIRPGSTNLAASKQAVEQLRRVGARLLGVVLNEVDVSGSRYKYYRYKGYYYSYHYYNYDDQTPSKRFPKNGFHLRKEKVESENKIN